MQNIKFSILILFLLTSIYTVQSQTTNTDSTQTERKIAVLAKVDTNKVTIRWAPTDPISWEYANQYGFIVERYTMVRKDKLIEKPITTRYILTRDTLKPAPLDQWEPFAETDDYVAVGAQAIFGETFELEDKQTDIMSIANKAKELENRFSFALFSADQSQKAAELMGLIISDNNVKKDEKYLYRVYTGTPREIFQIDTGFVFVDATKSTEYFPPTDVAAEFGDRVVEISWNSYYTQGLYTAYIVERSDDGAKSFFPVDDKPYVSATRAKNKVIRRMHYIDSLPQNNVNYHYRIRGKTPFGDLSIPSDTVEGIGYLRLAEKPRIIDTKLENNSKITVKWEFPNELNENINGFNVKVAEDLHGKYHKINTKTINQQERTFSFEAQQQANFIKIVALDHFENTYASAPRLVQLIDSIPPSPPTDLAGIVDTSGIVKLNWKANTEKDIYGYRVFMSNSPDAEFSQISNENVKDTFFVDTIYIKTLTKKIYYKVLAVDNHYNRSALSEILSLKRPDVIPPVAPVFTKYVSTDSCIHLKWNASPSDDAVAHKIYRRNNIESSWQLVKEIKEFAPTNNFLDCNLKHAIIYQYAITAIDDSKNESTIGQSMSAKLLGDQKLAKIANLKAEVNYDEKHIHLSWQCPPNDIEKYCIYRGDEQKPMILHKTISGNKNEYFDNKLTVNTHYQYRIKIFYKNGKSAPLTQVLQVKY